MHVGEPKLAALVAVGQRFVIDAAEVQDGGLHVVDVDGVLRQVPGEVVGLAKGRAALHSAGRLC